MSTMMKNVHESENITQKFVWNNENIDSFKHTMSSAAFTEQLTGLTQSLSNVSSTSDIDDTVHNFNNLLKQRL